MKAAGEETRAIRKLFVNRVLGVVGIVLAFSIAIYTELVAARARGFGSLMDLCVCLCCRVGASRTVETLRGKCRKQARGVL